MFRFQASRIVGLALAAAVVLLFAMPCDSQAAEGQTIQRPPPPPIGKPALAKPVIAKPAIPRPVIAKPASPEAPGTPQMPSAPQVPSALTAPAPAPAPESATVRASEPAAPALPMPGPAAGAPPEPSPSPQTSFEDRSGPAGGASGPQPTSDRSLMQRFFPGLDPDS